MNYLVTGGCGFIGSHLTDALIAQGNQVRVLDDLSTGSADVLSPAAELMVGDVCDADVLRTAMLGIDGCFHLANAEIDAGRQGYQVIQHSLFNILQQGALMQPGLPVVYASGASVYGDNASVRLGEDTLPRPVTSHAVLTLAAEHYARIAWLQQGIPSVGLRLFNVYGPGQTPVSPYACVVAHFAAALNSGKPLQVFGDGEQRRDFMFVSDVVEYFLAAMQTMKNEAAVLNIATGQAVSVNQLLGIIAMLAGEELDVERLPASGSTVFSVVGDPERLIKRFGFTTGVSLGSGLQITLRSGSFAAKRTTLF